MIARIWTRLFPNPRFYGWTIVGTGLFCSMLSAPGQSFAFSLYIDHFIADLGIGRVEVASLYALATLSAAAVLPVVGGWADRTNARRFLGAVIVAIGIALLYLSTVGGVVTLGIGFFLLRLLGQGAIGLGTLTATVRWFRRYRGRALAVVSLGYAVGELVFPGTIFLLIARLGWRGSLVALGAAYLLVFAPLVAYLSRDRDPAREPLDGEPARAVVDGHAETPDEVSFTFAQTIRSPTFWAMLLCVAVSPMVLTAVIFHQVAIFDTTGWASALVPTAFAAYALASVAMTYGMGMALERVPVRFGVTVSLLLTAAGFMWLLFAPGGGVFPAVLYGALLGLSAGASNASNSLIWPEYYGIAALGATKGVVNAVRNGATALGPPIAALMSGGSGSFDSAVWLFTGLAAVAGLAALAIRPPARPTEAVQAPA